MKSTVSSLKHHLFILHLAVIAPIEQQKLVKSTTENQSRHKCVE